MSLDGSADSIDEVPVIRTAPMVAVVAVCMLVYVPLTWSSQRQTWTLLADTPPLTLHRILLIIGTTALWVSPMLGLATTLHIAVSQRHRRTDRAVLTRPATLPPTIVATPALNHVPEDPP